MARLTLSGLTWRGSPCVGSPCTAHPARDHPARLTPRWLTLRWLTRYGSPLTLRGSPGAGEAAQGAGLRAGQRARDVSGDRLHQGVPLRHGLARIVQHLLPVVATDSDERGPNPRAAHQLVRTDPVNRQSAHVKFTGAVLCFDNQFCVHTYNYAQNCPQLIPIFFTFLKGTILC